MIYYKILNSPKIDDFTQIEVTLIKKLLKFKNTFLGLWIRLVSKNINKTIYAKISLIHWWLYHLLWSLNPRSWSNLMTRLSALFYSSTIKALFSFIIENYELGKLTTHKLNFFLSIENPISISLFFVFNFQKGK